jgi:ABC-2 type transport system permease protein
MNQLFVFFGVASYEFRMQIRRLAVWITFISLILLLSRGSFGELIYAAAHYPLVQTVALWTGHINTFLPLAIGCLLADRLPRDRHTKVDELFTTLPGALSVRLVGKYLGSLLALLVPLLAYYGIGIACILYANHNLEVIPLALTAFATITLPGLLFVAAFSIACPAILWVPLYQFLFIGYWFWGNLLPPRFGIPTLSPTLLTPIGGNALVGLFGVPQSFQSSGVTPLQSIESILLLLSIAVFVMVVLWRFLKWQQAQQ